MALLGALGLVGVICCFEIREYGEKVLDFEFQQANRSGYFNSRPRMRRERSSWRHSETREFFRFLEVPAGLCLALSSLAALAIWTSRNLRASSHFDPSLSKSSPRLAALSWFVPILNLVYPFSVLRSLWISVDQTRMRQRRVRESNPWGLLLATAYQIAAVGGFGLIMGRPVYAWLHLNWSGAEWRPGPTTIVSLDLWASIGLTAMCFLGLANVAILSRLIALSADRHAPSRAGAR